MQSGTRTIVPALACLALVCLVGGGTRASAQSTHPKYQPRRTSVVNTSHRSRVSRVTPTPAVKPVGLLEPACGCDAAPTCGCEPAPSCGCEVEPTCGCPTAPQCGCDPCCFRPLRALARGLGSVLDALVPCHVGCGYHCPVYPVGPCPRPPHRVGLLHKLGGRNCGCDSCGWEPACGCQPAGSYLGPAMPLSDPFLDDPEQLAPPAPPEEARRVPASRMQYSSHPRPATRPQASSPSSHPVGTSVVRRTSHSEPQSVSPSAASMTAPQSDPAKYELTAAAARQLPMRKHRELRRGSSNDDHQTIPEPAELPRVTARPVPAATPSLSSSTGDARPTSRTIPVNPLRAR